MATAVLVMSTIPALGSTNESKKIKTVTKQKQKQPLFNLFFLFFTKKKSEASNLQSYSVPILYLEETVVDPIGECYDIFGK